MRPVRVVLGLILIPALLAASDQVEGDLLCGGDLLCDIVLFPIIAFHWSVYSIRWLVTLPHPLLGKWESLRGLPDGSTENLRFNDRPFAWLDRRTVRTRKGSFRVEQKKLTLTYDSLHTGGTDEEVFSILVRSAATVLRDPRTSRYAYRQGAPGDASEPILGRWIRSSIPDAVTLDLRSDGTFEMQENHREGGSFKTTKNELKVQISSNGIREEDWQVRTANGHLFLTHDGNTVEYQHPRK
jgi:hypothetical protein